MNERLTRASGERASLRTNTSSRSNVSTDVRVLGVVEVRRAGKLVALGGVQQRRLVGLLAVHHGRTVGVSQIADALWDRCDQPLAPERTIQTYISRLRGALGDAVVRRDAGGYLIDSSSIRLDADEFRTLLRSARGRPAGELASELQRALSVWSGPAFGEFADEAWAVAPALALESLRVSALEDLFGARISLGEHRDVTFELEAAFSQNLERPVLTAHLMVALARSGRQADALRVFQRHRRLLLDDTGLDPARMLIELEQQILANDSKPGVPETVPEIRGYELQTAIGTGTCGTVYRARQPVTNRAVAVKVIDQLFADDPDFVRRFDARAQRIARLEHPNVAPLYDFWRERGAAYLVYRLFTGGNLADARQSEWELPHVSKLVNDVGGALSSGHRIGLFHTNLHDGNVLFDENERAILSDYPLHIAESSAKQNAAADCADFATLIWSVLAGRHVREAERNEYATSLQVLRPDLPEGLAELLERSISPKSVPAPSVEQFVSEWNHLSAACGVVVGVPIQWNDENPYKGLRPFDEGDAEDFFGREHLVETIEQRIVTERFVVVVGPSGSGKSSVIRAGLVPRMRDKGWFVATMRPGANPQGALADALALAEMPAILEQPNEPQKLLIVVDQLEELYSICESDTLRSRFLSELIAAAQGSNGVTRVIATLRADFLGVVLQHRELGTLMSTATVLATAMNSRELESCVRGPALRRGFEVDSSLVTQIVADVNARPGSLPMLQFALFELVEQRASRVLTLAEYDAIGGVGGALSRHGEAVFANLSLEEQTLMRTLVARLVSVSETQPPTSRRIALRDLPAGARVLFEILVARRLLTVSHDVTTREPIFELAHESILSEWDRIRGWLDQDTDDLRVLRHIDEAAHAWDAGGRVESDLYTGVRLQGALEWRSRGPRSLSTTEERFLNESNDFAKRIATQGERSLRRTRALSASLAMLLVLAVVGGVLAVGQRGRAQRVGYSSETKRLLATAVTMTQDDPAVAFLLALEGSRRRGDRVDANDAMLRVLAAQPSYLGSASLTRELSRLVLSRDGKRVIGIGEAQVVVVAIDSRRVLARRALTRSRTAPTITVGPLNTVIVSDGEFDLRLLNDESLSDQAPKFELSGSARATATSEDGFVLAVAGDFGSVDLWNVQTRKLLRTLMIPERGVNVAFTTNGERLVIGESRAVSVWDVRAGKELTRFALSEPVSSLLPAPKIGGIVLGSAAVNGHSTITLVDESSGVERWRVSNRSTEPATMSMLDSENVLVTDGSGIRRIHLSSGDSSPLGPGSARAAIGIRRGQTYVVADRGPTLTFRSTVGEGLLGTVLPGADGPCRLQASGDGSFVACTDQVRIWDVSARVPRLLLHDDKRSGFLLEQGRAVLIDRIGGWEIVDLVSGSTLKRGSATRTVLNGGPGLGPLSVASPTGRWLALGIGLNLWIVDLQTNASTSLVELNPLSSQTPASVEEVWFSVDGRSLFARLGNAQIRRWEDSQWINSPRNVPTSLTPPTSSNAPSSIASGSVWFDGNARGEEPVAVSRWSDTMLIRSDDSAVGMQLIKGQSGLTRLGGLVGAKSRIEAAAFDPTQRWIATVEADGAVRLWDVASRRNVGAPIASDAESLPVFLSGPNLKLVTVSHDRVVIRSLDTATWSIAACRAAGRNLTQAEWRELGPRGQPYQATCNEWPDA